MSNFKTEASASQPITAVHNQSQPRVSGPLASVRAAIVLPTQFGRTFGSTFWEDIFICRNFVMALNEK